VNRIITLYHGSGSQGYWAEEPVLNAKEWAKLRETAVKLLTARGKQRAAELLATEGFHVHKGANDWQDDFNVLHRRVGLDEYVRYDTLAQFPDDRAAFAAIAKVITELGPFIRFIGVELVTTDSPQPVSSPRIDNSSAAVERALIEAERLVTERNAASAVDRAHTALHGFVRNVCVEASYIPASDPSLTELLKWLRESHPKFNSSVPHREHSGKLLKAMGSICDTLGTLRNRASLAHANESLVDEPDAMLAINASRTVLHYIHQRLET
jgi:hypothetical protein